MKITYLILFFILVSAGSKGQFVDFDWVNVCDRSRPSYELHYIGVDQVQNVYHAGNYWISTDLDPGPGVFPINCPWSGAFVTKMDPSGNFTWGANISGNRFTYLLSQFTDPAGNTYLTGRFSGTTDFDPGPGVYNLSVVENTQPEIYSIFILKLGPNGEFKWAVKIADNGGTGVSIFADANGNVYTTGIYSGVADFDPGPGVYTLGLGSPTAFVLKLDGTGNFIWAKGFVTNSASYGYYLKQDNAGNIYISGAFSGTTDFDPGTGIYNLTTGLSVSSQYLVKLDAAGNFVWAKQNVGGPFVVDAAQNIFTLDINLSKYNASGILLWSKLTGGAPVSYDAGSHRDPIDIDAAGNIYINSIFRYTQDFDPGPGVFSMSTFDGGWDPDVFFSRFDNDGNFVWAKKFGWYADDFPTSIKLDAVGNIYSTGIYHGPVDFDPGPGVYTIASPYLSNIYVHKMSRCTAANGTSVTASSCNSYTHNNVTYNSSGTYYQTLQNAAGCDSLLTLNITIGGTNDTANIVSCDTFYWRNRILTSSGFYRDTVPAPGCNSIYNLNLTIKNRSVSTINAAICEGQNYAGYTLAGTYVDTLAAANGCDSIRTLNLSIKPKSYFTLNKAVCKGESYMGHSLAGTYIDNFMAANGCDSIRTLHLTVNPVYAVTIDKKICEGEIFLGHTVTGTYTDIFFTASGCDSILTTHLIVEKKPSVSLGKDTVICMRQTLVLAVGQFTSYLWQDGSTKDHFAVNQAGRYSVTVKNACGTATTQKNVTTEMCLSLFPGVFTPNQDGINDLFKITNGFRLQGFHLIIYNRYGQVVFETNDPLKGWDGNYKNQKQKTGAYTWHCTFTENNRPQNIVGTVLLLK